MPRFLLLLFLLIVTTPLYPQGAGKAQIPLPADLSGKLDGVDYKIRVPANWNGTLLLYAHGSASATVEVAPQTFPSTSPTLEEQLLTGGYALAGSYYADSNQEGVRCTKALTAFFNRTIRIPTRTLVWGESLGGTVVLQSLESYPSIYDGGIAMAPVAAGEAKNADFELRYGLAYAAIFGWPNDSWGPIENLRDDLYGNEATLIMPIFQWFDSENYTNYGQWEFIRLIMKLSPKAWWDVDPVVGLPGYALDGWKATAVRSHSEQMFGGPVAQNLGVVYTLTVEEKSYLLTLGVDVAERLAWMNAHTNIAARRSARERLEHEGNLTGKLRGPVVTVHGMFDPMLPISNEAVYRTKVDAAHRIQNLVQTYVNVPGHVGFSAEQLTAALNAVQYWLSTGTKPDHSFFPEYLGFDNTVVPPPWPY